MTAPELPSAETSAMEDCFGEPPVVPGPAPNPELAQLRDWAEKDQREAREQRDEWRAKFRAERDRLARLTGLLRIDPDDDKAVQALVEELRERRNRMRREKRGVSRLTDEVEPESRQHFEAKLANKRVEIRGLLDRLATAEQERGQAVELLRDAERVLDAVTHGSPLALEIEAFLNEKEA